MLGDNSVVVGNYVGVNVAGTKALSNLNGITIWGNGNHVGNGISGSRSVISGNINSGVAVSGGDDNLVQNNFVGTDVTGAKVIGVQRWGVNLFEGASHNLIGGGNSALRNVLSGNSENGINICDSGTSFNKVSGNYIGLDSTGSVPVSNGQQGVQVYAGAQHNIIGGTQAGERNVIGGNKFSGVSLSGIGTDKNVVSGNFIGVAPGGTQAIPNHRHGIDIGYGASNNTIGGDSVGERNVISGNNIDGVYVNGEGVKSNSGVVIGGESTHFNGIGQNYIGTDNNGITKVPNIIGVRISGGAHDNLLTGNVISGNYQYGVMITDQSTVHNRLEHNQIGTDLNGNALGNGRDGVYVENSSNSNSITDNTIAFNKLDGILIGSEGLDTEGGPYNLISRNSIHDNGRVASFASLAVPTGWVVTATATDATGNTSEFSPFATPKINKPHDSLSSVNVSAGQVNAANVAVPIEFKRAHDMAILELTQLGQLTQWISDDVIKAIL